MNYYALFPTVFSLMTIFFGIYSFLKNPKIKLNQIFCCLCIVLYLYVFSLSLMFLSDKDLFVTIVFSKINLISLIFFPIILLHLVVSFVRSKFLKYIKSLYFLFAIIAVIGVFTNLFYNGINIYIWGNYPSAGKLYILLVFQLVLVFSFSFYLLYKNLINSKLSLIQKEQIKYFISGLFLLMFVLFDIVSVFGKVNMYPFGYIFILFFAANINFCVLKINLIDFKLAVVQVVILFLIYSFIISVPLILYIKTNNGFISSIILLLLSLASYDIFKVLKTKIEKSFLLKEKQYHNYLLKVSKLMVQENDLSKLSKLIVRILYKKIQINLCAMFVYNEKEDFYSCIAHRGDRLNNSNLKLDEYSQIIKYIKNKSVPFVLSQTVEEEKLILKDIHKSCSSIMPVLNLNGLISFIVLGNKKDGSLYSQKDLDVFKILSNEICFAIENCNFMYKIDNQKKQFFEAEKLTKVGKMADGFANQLKNRLNQFYLMGEGINYELAAFKNSKEDFIKREDNVDIMLNYISQMADSIVDDVKQTNNILQNILNFTKTKDQNEFFSNFSLRQILEHNLQLLKIKYQRENIKLVLHLPNNDYIYGIKTQLQRAFFNFIDNAYHAILEKNSCIKKSGINIKQEEYIPQIIIELKYVNKNAKIYIQDNGIGIKPENINNVFSAFFTTKLEEEKNSGIGLYIIKKIIEETHKGKIEFRSKYGYGSTFLITLPTAI